MCVRDGEKWRGERREREDCVEWGPKTKGGGHVYKEWLK